MSISYWLESAIELFPLHLEQHMKEISRFASTVRYSTTGDDSAIANTLSTDYALWNWKWFNLWWTFEFAFLLFLLQMIWRVWLALKAKRVVQLILKPTCKQYEYVNVMYTTYHVDK